MHGLPNTETKRSLVRKSILELLDGQSGSTNFLETSKQSKPKKKSTSANSDLLYLQKGQSLWTAHIHWNSSRTIDLHHLTHHGVAYLPGYRNWKSSHASLLERSNSIPGNPPGVSAKWPHGAKSAPEECQIKAATCCLTVPSLPRNRKKGVMIMAPVTFELSGAKGAEAFQWNKSIGIFHGCTQEHQQFYHVCPRDNYHECTPLTFDGLSHRDSQNGRS